MSQVKVRLFPPLCLLMYFPLFFLVYGFILLPGFLLFRLKYFFQYSRQARSASDSFYQFLIICVCLIFSSDFCGYRILRWWYFSFTTFFLSFKNQQNLVTDKILDRGVGYSKMTSNSERLVVCNVQSRQQRERNSFWRAKEFDFVRLLLFFWPCHATCRILVAQPGLEPGPSSVEAESPNHWTSMYPLNLIFRSMLCLTL